MMPTEMSADDGMVTGVCMVVGWLCWIVNQLRHALQQRELM